MFARRPALAALLIALVVGGCASSRDGADPTSGDGEDQVATTTGAPANDTASPTASPATSPTEPPPFEVAAIVWEPCDLDVECGSLSVPLDHARPEGETIELALARRPARDPDRRIGVLAVNPGGPGGSGVALLRNGFSLGAEIDDRFDLVSWDPRGVGDSTAVTCGGTALDKWLLADPAPDDAAELEVLEQAAEALADECGAEDGQLLPHVGTGATVEDLDLIRASLGEDQLNYLGLSYGTFLGLLYLEAHPDRVRAMALDGVVDPAADLAAHARAQAGGFESAFDSMAAWCGAPGRCEITDALDAYDEVAARVEQEPLPAGTFTPLGPSHLTIAVAAALYDDESWVSLAEALDEARDGDGTRLASFAASYYSGASFTSYTAVICSDFGPPDLAGFHALADDLDADFPRFGASLAYELLPCAYWPTDPVRTPRPVRVPEGTAPVLIVAATGDPATPLSHAEAVADQIPSRLLVVDDDSHVALGANLCASDEIETYLLHGSLPDPGASC